VGRIRRRAGFALLADEVSQRPGYFFGEILLIVALSTVFEKAEGWLRKRLRAAGDTIGREILDALFREITILGFIGLLLFLLTHFTDADEVLVADSLYPQAAEPLSETFEFVHMSTFLLLLVLLFQGFAVLVLSREIADTWTDYECTRAFGEAEDSMESMLVDEGYIERRGDPTAPRGSELALGKPFTYGETVLESLLLRQKRVHKLVMWRAIRHGFLFQGPQSDLLRSEGQINPAIFSFRAFLEGQLGQIVLALVEVDVPTWFVSLFLAAAATWLCVSDNGLPAEWVLCSICWALLVVAAMFAVVLERDTCELTPTVPTDGRQILRLFAGTSTQMLRRSSWLSLKEEDDDLSSAGRRYRPSLGDCDMAEKPQISEHQLQTVEGGAVYLLVQQYVVAFRLLAFLQAIAVTSLIVFFLSGDIKTLAQAVPYALSWIEWPLMLYWAVPALVRRLTVRAAVTRTKTNNWYRDNQQGLVKQVMVRGTEGLLRECTRMIHLQGLEGRAALNKEDWTQAESVRRALSGRSVKEDRLAMQRRAAAAVEKGRAHFEELPLIYRNEIRCIFAAWDAENTGAVAPAELAQTLATMGFAATASRAAENLIRLVDDDSTGLLTWRKCQALIMLAVAERPMLERQKDLQTFFSRIKKASPRQVTVFELVEALPLAAISPNDVAALAARHFGKVKPCLTRNEFVEWVEAIEFATEAR